MKRAGWFWIVVILAMLVQLTLALSAVATKSATSDEPLHIYAGWRSLVYFDLRFNPEHPPLWKYWAALPSIGLSLGPAESAAYQGITEDVTREWEATIHDVYRIDPAQGHALIWRGRCMMALLAGGLTVAAAWLGRRLGGDWAGLLAAGAVAFDPNTLAHGPLVTNDVAITLMFVLVVGVLGRLCERLTWPRMALLIGLLGVSMGVKFTAVLLGPVTAGCLLIRALSSADWSISQRVLASRLARTTAAVGVIAGCAVGVYVLMWAMYGFREAVTPDGQRFSRNNFEQELRWFETHARLYPQAPTPADFDAHVPSTMGRLLLASDSARALPNAWNFGMTYAVARAGLRSAFLLGENDQRGWWYYFPVALCFKAPTASLLALFGVLLAGCVYGRAWWNRLDDQRRWLLVCIAVAVVIYAAQTMSSNLNIGFRHFFPAYFLLLIVTMAAVGQWARVMKFGRIVAGALSVGVLASAIGAYPNYLAYFNLPSRAVGRPIDLLGDSNLDWGQDLPLIADWIRRHPETKVYLSYFGTADPAAHGVSSVTPVYPHYRYGPDPEEITEPGVWIISGSHVQGIANPDFARRGQLLRDLPPREVLGESIYIYDAPPPIGGRAGMR